MTKTVVAPIIIKKEMVPASTKDWVPSPVKDLIMRDKIIHNINQDEDITKQQELVSLFVGNSIYFFSILFIFFDSFVLTAFFFIHEYEVDFPFKTRKNAQGNADFGGISF